MDSSPFESADTMAQKRALNAVFARRSVNHSKSGVAHFTSSAVLVSANRGLLFVFVPALSRNRLTAEGHFFDLRSAAANGRSGIQYRPIVCQRLAYRSIPK
jgi:hypothetical protein